MQEEKSAQHSADDACRDDEPQSFFLSAQVVALGESPAEVTGAERDGVRHTRSDGRDTQKHEHGEGDQRPATRERIDRARGYRGESDEEELDEHEAEYSIGRLLAEGRCCILLRRHRGKMPKNKLYEGNCLEVLADKKFSSLVDLTFLDPPFNQNKDYARHDDNLSPEEYWGMMKEVCQKILDRTSDGGAIYFMQREKNTEEVLRCLRESGWTLQNLIIWKKKTSAVPVASKFGKHYQILAYATKGEKARVFNRLRISPPLPANYKFERENGVYVTDVWDDIRELTSGYFAGDEAIREKNGERFHKQQSPIALLLRIILSSSNVGDTVFDPFAGTGTTLVTAQQLGRNNIGIEIDPKNVKMIQKRLEELWDADNVEKYYQDYAYTENLSELWGAKEPIRVSSKPKTKQPALFG